ncbi:MAG: hemerythrin domain-containing protein [Giesbergeria sp.]|jgi:hemerythrin-like domain-containing protein|nr:hemerythrin domain-containing protein [Giesbergeria sp.]MBP6159754.1 hemerythrin domain-containing protein [Giesbergeria sp.]MBP7083520.1 hemerythrin domain-containing protein [Giesbergeria sp.]MBP9785236.1 hemerythrin domain-containing protein [Giesbergeria sp.]MBP9896136.1 hemerythrin domain-containing protein [Giesbergeria sp.]
MTPSSLRTIHDEHAALAAVLKSLQLLQQRGPGANPQAFFDAMRAMLFYIDEFAERQHHPKESEWLFPRVAARCAEAAFAIERLDHDHEGGEAAVRELQHLLLAWELLGEARRRAFADALVRYVDFYLEHMRLEEAVVLPAALAYLQAHEWEAINRAFSTNDLLLTPGVQRDPAFDALYARIVNSAPSPIGLGG